MSAKHSMSFCKTAQSVATLKQISPKSLKASDQHPNVGSKKVRQRFFRSSAGLSAGKENKKISLRLFSFLFLSAMTIKVVI